GNHRNGKDGSGERDNGNDVRSTSSAFSYSYFDPRSWTYLYDHSPLEQTLNKYIDYKKLNLAGKKKNLLKFFVL
ncbi:MAG: hypothetical protein ACRD8Z_23615, partial [Nitrososphaeraceae archaeon]